MLVSVAAAVRTQVSLHAAVKVNGLSRTAIERKRVSGMCLDKTPRVDLCGMAADEIVGEDPGTHGWLDALS